MVTPDIKILYQDMYLRLLFSSLFVFIGTILIYLNKAKKRLETYSKNKNEIIENKYITNGYSPNIVIKIMKEVNQLEKKLTSIYGAFDSILWGGIIFFASCILGFMLELNGTNQELAIAGLFSGGMIFVVCITIIIYWDYKNQ